MHKQTHTNARRFFRFETTGAARSTQKLLVCLDHRLQ
jgi:hypothetical protein